MKLSPLKKATLPASPPLRKLLGPSFILLGLGLGSGEIILWPYLSAHFGLGIIWGALIGISLQFFLNMEIARYTLVTGESVFVGFARKWGRASAVWFVFSTLLPWMWPGIIAASALLISSLLGIQYTPIIPIIMLIIIGVILTLGPVLYKTQEKFQKTIILLGVPFIFILAFLLAKASDWSALSQGLVGKGNNFFLLPKGLPIATFLAALAYAGAGGNLNLSQSLYVKEKGYGMGKYAGHIVSLITGRKEKLTLTGTTFPQTQPQIKLFKDWWTKINIEHAIVFWATGAITMLLLSLLAYSTVFGKTDNMGIQFVISEAKAIGQALIPIFGSLFLLTTGVMLFFTQFSVFGSTCRIMSENLSIFSEQLFNINNSSRYFYFFLWLQIILGIFVFSLGFAEPLTLVIIGAVLNAFSMFIYSGLLLRLNTTSLHKSLQPSNFRKLALAAAFVFYGGFSLYTIFSYLAL